MKLAWFANKNLRTYSIPLPPRLLLIRMLILFRNVGGDDIEGLVHVPGPGKKKQEHRDGPYRANQIQEHPWVLLCVSGAD